MLKFLVDIAEVAVGIVVAHVVIVKAPDVYESMTKVIEKQKQKKEQAVAA